MKTSDLKIIKRNRRHKRIRAKVSGTSEKPRLAIFKSNTAVYAQLIDDVSGKTVASSSSIGMKGTPLLNAKEVGLDIAKKASGLSIKKIVFDRGGFIYTGKVKNLAEGAREGGLVF